MIRRALLALIVAWPLTAMAETVYVIDRLVVGLRSDITESATIVKSVESGAVLEVLERDDTRVRVRDPQGIEGWIDARYVSTQPPSRAQIAELQAENKRLRAAAGSPVKTDAGPKLAQLETELGQATTKLAQVQAELEQTRTALAEARRAPPEQRPAATATGAAPASRGGVLVWAVVGFAMLGIGFIAGMVWVRESIRRRMGGMYLRI